MSLLVLLPRHVQDKTTQTTKANGEAPHCGSNVIKHNAESESTKRMNKTHLTSLNLPFVTYLEIKDTQTIDRTEKHRIGV